MDAYGQILGYLHLMGMLLGGEVDSAESFLRIFQEVVSIYDARSFRKPDDDWYI